MTGVLTRYFRYIKPFLVLGFCVEVLGLGLMIRFRQSTNPIRELIGVQIGESSRRSLCRHSD